MKTVEHLNAVVHLKTARVYAHDNDGSPKIERLITKLANGKPFFNFVKHLHLKGFLKSEPPKIVRVLLIKDGEYSETDKTPWQKYIDETIAAKKKTEKVDYKELSEQQGNEIKKLKANNDEFEARLKSLEDKKAEPLSKEEEPKKEDSSPVISDRTFLETKAKELKIKFRNNIGNAKLLEKIQAIEPDFKL